MQRWPGLRCFSSVVGISVKVFVLLGLLGVVVGPATASSPKARTPADYFGVWQHTRDKARLVRLEETKCAWLANEELVACPARYEQKKVVFNLFGQVQEWSLSLKDEQLEIGFEGNKDRYQKMKTVPKAFDPQPIEVPRGRRVTKSQVAEVQRELTERESRDQAARNGTASDSQIKKIDHENTTYLRETVKKFGWIDVKRFGIPAANAAWTLVVHSGDLPLMRGALPYLERDRKKNREAGAQNYASLFDRVQIQLGEKQRYGTQIVQDENGSFVVFPLEKPKLVDRLRKKIGLTELELELAKQEKWTGSKVTIQDF